MNLTLILTALGSIATILGVIKWGGNFVAWLTKPNEAKDNADIAAQNQKIEQNEQNSGRPE